VTPSLTSVFVRLKVRLLRNVLRTSGGPGLVVFTVVAIGSGIVVGQTLRWSTDLERFVITPILGALLMISWVFGPVLFGNSDETIDTTRLALIPLDPRGLARGLAVQAVIGPGPVAALIALAGAASRAPTLPAAVLAAAACIGTIVLATTLSRVLLTALGSGLRRRRSRDLATLATGLVVGAGAISLQVFAAFGNVLDLEALASIADVVRLTPFGWPSDALGRASTGALLVPLVELIGTAALVVVAIRTWALLLERALTEVSEHEDQMSHAQPLVSTETEGPVSSLTATFVKERRYFSRHPRYRVQVMSQATVLVLGGAPFLGAIVDREPTAVLFGCIPALTAGVTGANLLGPDGRALWAEYLALPSLTPLLRGRSLTFGLLGVAAATLLTVGSAIWTGGWQFIPAALGAAIGMALTGAGVGSITSVLAPSLYPDDQATNPFATSAPGSGCLPAAITFAGVLVGLVLCGPILYGLAAARDADEAIVLVTGLAPLYGIALWFATTAVAGRRIERRGPELVAFLGSA
jgi:ABC-2 type transport system permease protein